MAKGRKICSGCNKEIGARVKVCDCGFVFSAKKEIQVESTAPKEVNKDSLYVQKVLARESHSDEEFISINMSSKDHAQRILDYGRERATFLLSQHRFGNTWSHVDWKLVEEGLK